MLFDNEEVGSRTSHGAASPIVDELISRLTKDAGLVEVAKRKSFLISADMAHACHPNWSGMFRMKNENSIDNSMFKKKK